MLPRIILFQSRAANHKPRIPNSILSLAATLEGRYDYVMVDGNLEAEPYEKWRAYVRQGYDTLAVTVMPGPQLEAGHPLYRRNSKNDFLNWSPSGRILLPTSGRFAWLRDLWTT